MGQFRSANGRLIVTELMLVDNLRLFSLQVVNGDDGRRTGWSTHPLMTTVSIQGSGTKTKEIVGETKETGESTQEINKGY